MCNVRLTVEEPESETVCLNCISCRSKGGDVQPWLTTLTQRQHAE